MTSSFARRAAGLLALAGALSGCQSLQSSDSFLGVITPYRIEVVQGNVITSEQIALAKPGLTRAQVRDVLGSPLLADPFHADRWDYVFTIRRQGAEPQLRRIIVRFKADVLETVEGVAGLPSEHEFVTSIDTFKTARNAPPLVLSDEQIKALPAPARPRKQLKRSQVAAFFARLPACLIGMEACGGAHYWARKLTEFGHTVKLMAPQFVKPYVKTNKNDAADAEAICEAVGRPNMRFVPVKNVDQQALLGLHRARQGFVKERTAQVNQIRGLLAEFGLIVPVGIHSIEGKLPGILEDAENGLSGASRSLFARLFEHFRALDRHVDQLEREINAWHRDNVDSQRLQAIPGIGPLTASAIDSQHRQRACFS